MKRNKIAAVLLGMGLMAGMLALPVTVPTRPVHAAAATEQVIGHGEWKQEDGKWYYYQDGEILKNCWLKDGIDWYYLNEDGSMKADEWFTDTDGNIYYFRTWGGMQYNAWGSLDGERYYFRSWGAAWNNGWHQIGGQWYYFHTNGTAMRNTTELVDRDIYSFDEEGRMLHDTWVTSGDNLYYLRSWGGALNTGWNRLNGEWYYFDTETAAAWRSTTAKIGRDIYSFDEEGRMLHDTWVTSGKNLYYLRSWGGALNTGWNRLDGEWYYFDTETAAAWRSTTAKIGRDIYSFDEEGRMLHDTWVTSGENLYYLRSWGGALNTGWNRLDGEWYYFDTETAAAWRSTTAKIDRDIYSFDEEGRMLHDTWLEVNGIHYYFRSWGGAMHDQTAMIDGKEYVFDSNGNGTVKDTSVPTPEPTETPTQEPTETPEPTPTETPEEIKVNKITVSGNQEMTTGATQRLTATVVPENAANKNVSWSSSNSDVASVASDGTVTAHQAGTVTVKATAADGSGVSGNIQITVKAQEVEVSELYILDANGVDQKTTLTAIGETSQLTLDIRPENATNKSVTWWSGDEDVVTVDQNGKVTAVSEGWAYVYAKTANGCVDNTVVEVTLPKTDADYLNEIVYDEEMSRQVFDLVNQQRVLEGHLEMEWLDGNAQNEAIAMASYNLLHVLNGDVTGDSVYDSLSNHSLGQNGAGGQKYNLTAEDIFNMWMNSPAHKSNQMDDSVTQASYVVMYVPYDNGSKMFSAVATLCSDRWNDDIEYDFAGNGMGEIMDESEFNTLIAHFK